MISIDEFKSSTDWKKETIALPDEFVFKGGLCELRIRIYNDSSVVRNSIPSERLFRVNLNATSLPLLSTPLREKAVR